MVEVTVEDRATLESWIRATTTEQRLVLRARIILALARGQTNREVAEELSIRPATVSKWRTRFATKGIGGLADAPRSGKPPTYTEEAERRVLSQLDEDPPPGYARWNGPLLAQVLTDVSETQVWRILRRHGISLERRRSWCVSTDPEFDRKAADVVGLYLDPPENAVVLCVDEKPHIQALDRPSGRTSHPWARSKAWMWGFSSTQRTTAFSGASRYRPTTSAALRSNSGSVLTHQLRRRSSEIPWRRRMRQTCVSETSVRTWARSGPFHRAYPGGGSSSSWESTRRSASSV